MVNMKASVIFWEREQVLAVKVHNCSLFAARAV